MQTDAVLTNPRGRVPVPDADRHVDRDLTQVWCRQFQQEFVLLWDTELCPYCGREV
jgi:hypothetical protein